MTSTAELLLSVQLEQAGIPFEREYPFDQPLGRGHRADFMVPSEPADLLVEVDGGTWVSGRHNRGSSIAKDFEKGALAAICQFRVIHCTTDQVNDGTCLSWIKQAINVEDNRDAA